MRELRHLTKATRIVFILLEVLKMGMPVREEVRNRTEILWRKK